MVTKSGNSRLFNTQPVKDNLLSSVGAVGTTKSGSAAMPWLGVCTPLETIGLGIPTGVAGLVRQLSDDEWNCYEKATKALGEFRLRSQGFDIYKLNDLDYHKTVLAINENFGDSYNFTSTVLYSAILSVNRALLNLFSAFRTWADHWEASLKHDYGKQSEQIKFFKKVAGEEYDGNFSYRFLYKLRNYAQHCGMPLGKLNWSAYLDPLEPTKATKTLDLFFLRDSLLERYDEWGTVEPDIKNMPELFAVTSIVEKLLPSVQRIETIIISHEVEKLRPHVQFLKNLANEAFRKDSAPCVYTDLGSEVNQKPSYQRIQLALLD